MYNSKNQHLRDLEIKKAYEAYRKKHKEDAKKTQFLRKLKFAELRFDGDIVIPFQYFFHLSPRTLYSKLSDKKNTPKEQKKQLKLFDQ